MPVLVLTFEIEVSNVEVFDVLVPSSELLTVLSGVDVLAVAEGSPAAIAVIEDPHADASVG